MKSFPAFRYRPLIFSGMLAFALSWGGASFSSTNTASTTASALPAAPAPPAPAGMAANEIDKETGKPVITTPSGLKYVELAIGTGPSAKTGDHLAVNYEGRLFDETKFDSSYDRGQPFNIVLGVTPVIKGWTEGLAGMKQGGSRKLVIPPQLGYGLQGAGDVIPPNATLFFKVEIVSLKPGA